MPGKSKLLNFLGKFCCWLGIHNYCVIDASFGFGTGGNVEKIQCQRCSNVTIRSV